MKNTGFEVHDEILTTALLQGLDGSYKTFIFFTTQVYCTDKTISFDKLVANIIDESWWMGSEEQELESTSYRLSKRKRMMWTLSEDRALEQELLDKTPGTLTEQRLRLGLRFEGRNRPSEQEERGKEETAAEAHGPSRSCFFIIIGFGILTTLPVLRGGVRIATLPRSNLGKDMAGCRIEAE